MAKERSTKNSEITTGEIHRNIIRGFSLFRRLIKLSDEPKIAEKFLDYFERWRKDHTQEVAGNISLEGLYLYSLNIAFGIEDRMDKLPQRSAYWSKLAARRNYWLAVRTVITTARAIKNEPGKVK